MALSLGTELLQTLVSDTGLFGLSNIVNLLLTAVTMLIITRDVQKWKIHFFPIMLGWHIAGVSMNVLFMMIAGITSLVAVIGTEKIGQLAGIKRYDNLKAAREKAVYGTARRRAGSFLIGKNLTKKQQRLYIRKGEDAVRSAIIKGGRE